MKHLPPESACASLGRDGKPPWTITDHLLDDLRMVQVHSKKRPAKPHPDRPTGKRKPSLDSKRIAAGRRRRAERQRAIAAGEIT